MAGVASANVEEGGASAPEPAGGNGGLTAPAEGGKLAGLAQAEDPEADAPGGVDQPSPVEPGPDSGAPESGEPEPGVQPPAADDRGVDVVVPLPPDEPAGELAPTVLATPTVSLPRTGQDSGVVALIGLSLLAAGGSLRLLSRRARAASA